MRRSFSAIFETFKSVPSYKQHLTQAYGVSQKNTKKIKKNIPPDSELT